MSSNLQAMSSVSSTNKGYDRATKLWTTLLGMAVMGIVQFLALVQPGRERPVEPVNESLALLAGLLGLLAPVCWLIGSARFRRDDRWSWIAVVALIGGWVVLSLKLAS